MEVMRQVLCSCSLCVCMRACKTACITERAERQNQSASWASSIMLSGSGPPKTINEESREVVGRGYSQHSWENLLHLMFQELWSLR